MVTIGCWVNRSLIGCANSRALFLIRLFVHYLHNTPNNGTELISCPSFVFNSWFLLIDQMSLYTSMVGGTLIEEGTAKLTRTRWHTTLWAKSIMIQVHSRIGVDMAGLRSELPIWHNFMSNAITSRNELPCAGPGALLYRVFTQCNDHV